MIYILRSKCRNKKKETVNFYRKVTKDLVTKDLTYKKHSSDLIEIE